MMGKTIKPFFQGIFFSFIFILSRNFNIIGEEKIVSEIKKKLPVKYLFG